MNTRSIIQRYPLASYFILAYGISWIGSFAVVGPKFLRGDSLEFIDGMYMVIPMLAGPFIAGLLMTFLVSGKKGLSDLLSRMGKWRVGLGWYAAALLIFPILILATLLTLSAIVSANYFPGFIAFGIMAGLFAGFFEEIGWMGFAYPNLQVKYGALRAAIFLGLLHGIWHVVAGYLADSQGFGELWLPRFIIMWIIAMTAMRIILVWIYANTGSVLLAQLTHASSTGSLVIFAPSAFSPGNEVFWWAIYAACLWLVAAFIIWKYGDQLENNSKRGKAHSLLPGEIHR